MTSHRLISGIIFAVIFLTGLFHPWFFWVPPVIVVLATWAGVWEFSHLGEKDPPRPQLALSMACAFMLLLDGYRFHLAHGIMIVGGFTVLTIALGLTRRGVDVAALAGKSVIAPLYVALPFTMILKIWQDNQGIDPVWPNRGAHYLIFLIIATWASDIGAYFSGRMFGRHKLAPTLSPGKTVEGFIGGVIFTAVACACAKGFWNNIDAIFTWTDVMLLGLSFSVIGPMGDLAESQLKRTAGAKDSGKTFTGHGGMLDIVDSLLFTTIFYYVYLFFMYRHVITGEMPPVAG